MTDINDMGERSGRLKKEDNTTENIADHLATSIPIRLTVTGQYR